MRIGKYKISTWILIISALLWSGFAIGATLYEIISKEKPEGYTDFYLLEPGRKAKDYPFIVGVGEEYSVYVGVGNHMGGSENYMVYVKFRNQTHPLPNSKSSPLPPLYEFQFSVADGEKWEELLRFKFLEVLRHADPVRVRKMLVNNVILEMDSSTRWDSKYSGFYFQLFFELWLYNKASQSFQYHNRFVGIWLNMTSS